MNKSEIIERLKNIAGHTSGEAPFVMGLDDGIAVHEAIELLEQPKRQEADWIYGEDSCGQDGWTCSECGFFVPWYYEYYKNIDFIWKYKTCPCCDAKMVSYTGKKGEENEQGH